MPILSRVDLRAYLEADLKAYNIVELRRWRPWHGFKYPLISWQRKLRRLEYAINCSRGPFAKSFVLLRRYRFRMASIRYGFTIPPNVFGPGLTVAHWGTIVVNDKAKIGANCRIHPGTCLGEKSGLAPTLGDSCYIGPGAKLIGGIRLGNRVIIGANAVVTHSFGDGAVLAGVPAKVISRN